MVRRILLRKVFVCKVFSFQKIIRFTFGAQINFWRNKKLNWAPKGCPNQFFMSEKSDLGTKVKILNRRIWLTKAYLTCGRLKLKKFNCYYKHMNWVSSITRKKSKKVCCPSVLRHQRWNCLSGNYHTFSQKISQKKFCLKVVFLSLEYPVFLIPAFFVTFLIFY